jgi:LysR family transcriptional regulator, glycine cleavage system transcriptional activator
LRAFEAAARHLSFKHAANELCVTPGAVSQQVRALDQAFGVALFRHLALLVEGRVDALLRPASGTYPGFHAERIERCRDGGTTTPVDIITVPGLAEWGEHRALLGMLKG